MSLTNAQYDEIMRDYHDISQRNKLLLEQRIKEVYTLCPEYRQVEDQITNISMDAAVARVLGDTSEEFSSTTVHKKILCLKDKLSALLTSIRKPADYLAPIYTCPECKDTGYIDGSKCSCFKKRAIDLVYRDSNLKNLADSDSFEHFSYEWYRDDSPNPVNGLTPLANIRQVLDICKRFVRDFDTDFSNLLLFGETGTGKTFLSNCIARELLSTSHSVIYLTAIELFEKLAKNDFGNDYDQQFVDLEFLTECDLLIIDDLGTEVCNSYTSSRLFHIINERLLKHKSVIISTNLGLADLRELYSERIYSRITSSYTIIKLFGDDIRMLKRKANR